MAEKLHTPVLVIGGGPGGYAAAFRAADLGADVMLVDRDERLGGACLHRGCIPSKALLHAGRTVLEAREAGAMGIRFGAPRIDGPALARWRESIVDELCRGVAAGAERRGITVRRGRAHFLAEDLVEVVGDEVVTITFDHVILAPGARPTLARDWRLPSGRVIYSHQALQLENAPPRLLIVGGGYIGLELGEAFSALGSEVHLVEVGEGMLPGADRDLVAVLEERVRKLIHTVALDVGVSALRDVEDGVEATFSEGADLTPARYDRVLVAIGRRPNSDGMGLENTAIRTDEDGFLIHDPTMRTTQENAFVVGDAAGTPMLAHKAAYQGAVAAEVITGQASADDVYAIPHVVFTDPEVAWCGMTETAAVAQNLTIDVARCPWSASGRARTVNASGGLTKLIVDPSSQRVLGVGIVGRGAGDLIAEGVIACEMAARVEDVARSIHPHPTLSETLAEAAERYLHRGSEGG